MPDRLLLGTNIPKLFNGVRLTDYDLSLGSLDVFDRLAKWEPTDSRPNALFVGRPGKGKTMMACAHLNEYQIEKLPAKKIRDRNPGVLSTVRQDRYPVYFLQLAELVKLHLRRFRLEDQVKMGRNPQEYFDLDQFLEDLSTRVHMLVLDDVGKEHRTSSGFAQDEFDLLVRTRTNNGLPTIFTSNVALSRWSTHYSESMQSLIQRTSLVVTFK